MGRNVFPNIPSGPCVYARFTRARHPPSASRPSQKPRPPSTFTAGDRNHRIWPRTDGSSNRFSRSSPPCPGSVQASAAAGGYSSLPPRGAAPGTPGPPRLRTPDASEDLSLQLWNSQKRQVLLYHGKQWEPGVNPSKSKCLH